MPPTVGSFLLLFLCAAAWTVIAAACGGFFALFCSYIGKTGNNPIPRMPKISLFRRKPADEDDDEQPTNGRPRQRESIGP